MVMKCDAMLFADRAIQERSGKWGLIGIFDRFSLPNFPTGPLQTWWVFVVLRELEVGKREFAVNLVREGANQVLASMGGEIDVQSAQQGITIVLPMQRVGFVKPDVYSMTVHIDGTFVTSRELAVVEIGSQQGG